MTLALLLAALMVWSQPPGWLEWMGQGQERFRSSDFMAADKAFRSALAELQSGDDDLRLPRTLQWLGATLVAEDSYRDAREVLIRALGLLKRDEGGHASDIAEAQLNRGHILISTGRKADAERSYREALRIFQHLQNPSGAAVASFGLANLYRSEGSFVKAEPLMLDRVRLSSGHPVNALLYQSALGDLYRQMKHYAESEKLLTGTVKALKRTPSRTQSGCPAHDEPG